jgi:hypothetical protein
MADILPANDYETIVDGLKELKRRKHCCGFKGEMARSLEGGPFVTELRAPTGP